MPCGVAVREPRSDVATQPASLALTRVATGLNTALYVTAPPGDSARIFVVRQTGTIQVLRHDSLLTTPFLNLSGMISLGDERGLLSMAFHPNYASNGFFMWTTPPRTATSRSPATTYPLIPTSPMPARDSLLLNSHSAFGNHNGGLVAFGPDGYLYIGTGDGGGGGDPDGNGQDSTVLLGKILRVDGRCVPLCDSAEPPFVGRSGADEVWAYGLRNPWRFPFDRMTQDFYIGDVGQDDWEEIDFAPAGGAGGRNYGWNTMEGTHCYEPSSGCVTSGEVRPIYEYRSASGACSVTGGYVYRGTQNPGISGRYFFAEYCAGWVRSLKMVGGVATDVQEHRDFGTLREITSFGEDARGELYITRESGSIA